MQLSHTFDLPAPVDRVFDVFSRLDQLAPCFPGATVFGCDEDVYHGAVRIKFGPFPLVFEGTARVVRADLSQHRLVVKANARDRRGAAAGAATVTATVRADGAGSTKVDVVTELDLTGRPAQLGSGVISSVSDRLADQFVGCLSARFEAGLGAEPAAGVDSSGVDSSGVESSGANSSGANDAGADDSGAVETEPAATKPGGQRSTFSYPPPTPVDSVPHLQVLPDLARTWLPWAGGAVGALAVVVVVVRWLRRR